MRKIFYRLFVILFIFVCFRSFSMEIEQSKRYKDFINELNKSNPSVENLSDRFLHLSEKEQRLALGEATRKNIDIVGLEDEQKKIRLSLGKNSGEKIDTSSPKKEHTNIVPSGKEERNSLEDFKELINSNADIKSLEKALSDISSHDLEEALKIATSKGIIFKKYSEQQRKLQPFSETEIIQSKIVEAEAKLSKIIDETKKLETDFQEILDLSDKEKTLKKDLEKFKKDIEDNNQKIKILSSKQETKDLRLVSISKNQNNRLLSEQKELQEKIKELDKKINELNKD